MKHTTEIEVSAKKGDTQKTRWLVTQLHPYPRIRADGGGLCWQNYEKIFSSHCNPAVGIGQLYHCYLLADNCPAELPEDYNRSHFAGYVPYANYGTPQQPANGGAIKLRGQDFGETLVSVETRWVTVKVRGGCNPTATEAAFFKSQIEPALLVFIEANRASLKSEAVAAVKARFVAEIKEKRAQLSKLEAETLKAIY